MSQFGENNLKMISGLASQLANQNQNYEDPYDEEEAALRAMEDAEDMGDDTVYFSMNDMLKINDNPGSRDINKGQPNKPDFNHLKKDEDIIDYFLDNNPDWVICEYFKRGNCKYGDGCKFMHPKSMNGIEAARKVMGKNGQMVYEGDDECVICLEKVLANNRKFGILENCCHAFCLDCIRDWRATYDKKVKKTHYRTCPICRENSYLVIPSTRMIYEGNIKDELIDEYCEALANIPCKHFGQGSGYCPF